MMRLVLLTSVLCCCTPLALWAEVDFDQIPYVLGVPECIRKCLESEHLHWPSELNNDYYKRQLETIARKTPCTIPGFNRPGACVYFRDQRTRAIVIYFVIDGILVAIDDNGVLTQSGLPL
jgi:hypothetical protein